MRTLFNSANYRAGDLSALGGGGKPLKVSHIEHEARAAGLLRVNQTLTQSRVLRDARLALGLAITRESADSGAWVWAEPGAMEPTLQNKPQAQPNPPGPPEGQSTLLSKAVANAPIQPGQMQQVA